MRNIGFDNVTIKNGRMVDWDWGVALNTGTRRNIVENVRPELTQEAAIGLGHIAEPDPSLPIPPPDPFPSADSGVQENVIRDNTIIGNGRGVWATANTLRTLIANNAFVVDERRRGLARALAPQPRRAQRDRRVQRRRRGARGLDPQRGGRQRHGVQQRRRQARRDAHRRRSTCQSNDNLVERNSIDESGGIEIIESDRNTVRDNIVRRANDSAVSMDFARDSARARATTCAPTRAGSSSRTRPAT